MNQEIYKSFNDALATRLEKQVYTTEDSIRYTFFAIVIEQTTLAPDDIVMEFPHNTISGAEIDTYIPAYQGEEVIIEFKYDRALPSGRNAPRTQKAGKLFNDMKRLLEFNSLSSAMRLFIYLTDYEMTSYLRNPSNDLVNFFDLALGDQLKVDVAFFDNKPVIFKRAAGGTFTGRIECDWSNTLPRKHQLRIYRVAKL